MRRAALQGPESCRKSSNGRPGVKSLRTISEIGVSIICPLTDYPVCENCVIPLCIVMQSAELATGVLTIQQLTAETCQRLGTGFPDSFVCALVYDVSHAP